MPTTFTGPIRSGTVREGASVNAGRVVLTQTNTIAFTDTTKTMFILPKGFRLLNVFIDTTTAFNAATTNTMSIGKSGGTTTFYVAATACGSTGRQSIATTGAYGSWLDASTADVTITATYAQSGTAATTGAGNITVEYEQI